MGVRFGGSARSSRRHADDDHAAEAAASATVLIIGNGMVSHRLCDRLVSPAVRGPRPKVTVLGEESRPAYDRVRLGEMLRGRHATSLSLASPAWYEERGIELVLGDPAVSIDREKRVVTTRSGRTFPYDHLVFATGAAPVVPAIDIADPEGVFVIRTTKDLERLRDRAQGARRVAVIGGGLLGLETAKSLRDASLDVTVVESTSHLMARQLDDEAADLLKSKLEQAGMAIVVGAQVDRIASTPGRQQIVFARDANRGPLEVDFVVISVGVQPRDELAVACGLERGKRGGIAIDRHLCTSDPHVYAIGDCASIDGISYGLVAPGYRMAEALAATLLGKPTTFAIPAAPVALKVAGVEVVTLGQTGRRPSHKTFRYRHKSVYRRVVVEDDGRVVGATAVGGWPELGVVQEAIDEERHLTQTGLNRFTHGEALWSGQPRAARVRPDAEIVCACASVTAGTIRLAIAGGCKTADEVSCQTGAARGCGSCLPVVALMVGQKAPAGTGRARKWLAGFGAAALAGLVLAMAASPVAFAALLDRSRLDFLYRDPFWQQVSGFTLLGTCALTMLLPIAKRAVRVNGSALPMWRAVHAGIGLGALAALVIHTSLRRGHNMNLLLETAFATLLLLGAGAGIFGLGRAGKLGRVLRLAHLVVFWPLLSLIGLHVLAVYYF